MTGLLHDLRSGLRALRAAPLTAAAAVLVIALGAGANLAVFAVALDPPVLAAGVALAVALTGLFGLLQRSPRVEPMELLRTE